MAALKTARSFAFSPPFLIFKQSSSGTGDDDDGSVASVGQFSFAVPVYLLAATSTTLSSPVIRGPTSESAI